jgi:hypothetical protein
VVALCLCWCASDDGEVGVGVASCPVGEASVGSHPLAWCAGWEFADDQPVTVELHRECRLAATGWAADAGACWPQRAVPREDADRCGRR